MADGSYRSTLSTPGLQPFLWTQFLGAFNDNVCKIVVTFLTMAELGAVTGATLAGAIFILPYLAFSGYAGHLADAYSKQRVLVWTKGLEIVAMALMLPALLAAQNGGGVSLLLAVLFLMSLQSTFFSPAKYGIVPELLGDAHLSRANGLLEMSTFVAIVLGSALGGEVFEAWRGQPWLTAGLLTGIAVAGTLTSLRIPQVAAAQPGRRISVNPWREIGQGLARIWPDRTLRMTVIGVSFFWFLGALIQLAVLPLGMQELRVGEAASTRLFTALAIGIGAGSLAAGRLSGEKVEPGLVPIGAFGMGVFSLLMVAAVPNYALVAAGLVLIGFAGGCFAVPLNALLQQRPGAHEKGRVLATNNVFNTIAILAASAVLYLLGERAGLSASQILAIFGAFTLVATVYVLSLVPDFFVRFVLWMLTHTVYRIRILGREHIPSRGPALIIANHMSMIDGALIGASVQRFVRFLVYGPHFRKPGLHWLMTHLHAIPITGGKREVVEALARARAELQAGHVVCIFVEGAVSRTGNLLPFKRGFERIVEGLDVPIVPVYLDGVWGSIFSFKGGKFFWKRPERIPYPVTVAFGRPLPATVTAVEARQALLELGADAFGARRPATDLLHTEFMRVARRHWGSRGMADSTGQKLTYGRALVGALLFGKIIRRLTEGQEHVGLLLPSSVGGALANIATLCAGRVPVNLNFTVGAEAMALAIQQADIRTIVTSKKFLAKAGIDELPGMVFLEDLREKISPAAKILTLLEARLLPRPLLRRRHGGHKRADSLATIIFSSGSTGIPKGVMITHRNILSNIDGLAQIFPVNTSDTFIGVLPFFHSFGLTGTLWFPLLQGAGVAYHPNPADAKTIGELAETYKGTMLISTPTFCNAYVRRCTKEQFAHLKYAIVGAEKLREPLATTFEQQYGVGLLEGYGCTEMAPVVSVNRPDIVDRNEIQIGAKFGSVGHPIPGVAAKVVDRDTGEGPLYGREGLLLVKGPNMMTGYLHQPEKTADVIRDGWYATGDIAMIDEDGFIFITDRLSRFSKIGGEMVPHVRIEEAINVALGEACCAVTAVPDAAKGEKLVAFYTRADVAPEALWAQLSATDLPRLWLPRRECLVTIDAIPTLGTGKVDLRKLKTLAAERTGTTVA
jgi:acyl-[acyl-carrier-protein]-phospholipid O-acyltransferase/long-chain-fatty-acid--[acyl-carrier-protein] ligase